MDDAQRRTTFIPDFPILDDRRLRCTLIPDVPILDHRRLRSMCSVTRDLLSELFNPTQSLNHCTCLIHNRIDIRATACFRHERIA